MLNDHPCCPECRIRLSYVCQQNDVRRYSCSECNGVFGFNGHHLAIIRPSLPVRDDAVSPDALSIFMSLR